MSTAAFDFPTAEQLPDAFRVDPERWSMRYLIDGEVRTWTGPSMEVTSPVCLKAKDGSLARTPLGRLPSVDRETALQALAAANAAWDRGNGAWPRARVEERIAAVERFLAGMAPTREEVVRLLMWEIAKPRKEAEAEFDRTVSYIRDTLEALKALDRDSSRFTLHEGTAGQIRRAPLGPTLCMGPFNYPLNETFTTLVPAILMGNPVVVKLPKYGGLSQIPLLQSFCDAFPRGVVNVVQGDGPTVVGPILASGEINCLAFIGCTPVANLLRAKHPSPNRMRCVLGLGAKNPAIVMEDADLDVAVKECTQGALTFNGQRCTALKILFVHERIADAFVDRLSTSVSALRAGMPWDDGVQLTPLPEEGKTAWLSAMLQDATARGAKVVNAGGGQSVGTYFHPAVLYPVAPSCKLYSDEQFGPLVPVVRYREVREVEEYVRQSSFGQQLSIFGRDPRAVGGLVDALVNQVSRINLNTQCRRGPDAFPFTGRKDSAEGTLSVHDALRAFSIRTVVATTLGAPNRELLTSIVTGRSSAFLTTDFLL